MLIESGMVVSSSGNRALVKTHRGEACSACGAASACMSMGGGKEMRVEVLNYIQAKAGDRVELALPESSFVRASAITYLIPLIAVMGGALAGHLAAEPLGWSANGTPAVMAGLGLLLAIPVVAALNKKLSTKENYIPRIVSIKPPLPDGNQTAADAATCHVT
jgi:sigma-E factor negative regulatory protein RseC